MTTSPRESEWRQLAATTCTAWPSGSRTRKPRTKPRARSSTSTTPGETNRTPAAVSREARRSRSALAVGLPMDEVIGALVGQGGPAVARAQVLQELNPGARGGAQTGDAQARAGDVVEPLLLRPIVEALPGDLEPQQVAVEAQARVRVPHH